MRALVSLASSSPCPRALALGVLLLGVAGTAREARADDAVERAVAAAPCALTDALRPSAAAALAHHDPLDTNALRALAEAHGLPAPSVRAWVGRGRDEASAARLAAAWIADQHDGTPAAWRRCAVARDGATWAVVLAPRVAQVVAGAAGGALAAGARATVRVLLPRGARALRVAVAAPGAGSVAVRDAAAGADAVEVAFDRGEGVYALQALADTARGPLPFATWHVAVGAAATAPPPTRPAVASPERTPREPPAATTDDPRRVLWAINRARARAGLGPLRPDPLLAALAAERATALAARGVVVHALDPGDTPAERLAAAHVGADRVAENVARARSLADASARLDASPAHRANRLDPTLDAAGIGAVASGGSVYLVELFAARPRITE